MIPGFLRFQDLQIPGFQGFQDSQASREVMEGQGRPQRSFPEHSRETAPQEYPGGQPSRSRGPQVPRFSTRRLVCFTHDRLAVAPFGIVFPGPFTNLPDPPPAVAQFLSSLRLLDWGVSGGSHPLMLLYNILLTSSL